jgi:hypothetical protein
LDVPIWSPYLRYWIYVPNFMAWLLATKREDLWNYLTL